MAPPGLTALGAKGSVRDRLTPSGRAPGFRTREVYSTAALARYGALWGASINAAFGGENHTTALRAREIPPPFGGWRHYLSRWEACHWILSRLRLLANPVPLPPLRGGTMGT